MSQRSSYRVTEFGQPLELQRDAIPEPRGTEVLVRVTGCGVCHTDLHVRDGYFDLGGGRKARIGGNPPLTPGHEIVGEVAALGPGARGAQVGDQRVVYPWIGCGEPTCAECGREREHMCGKRALGVFVDGGYSEYVLVPDARYLVSYKGLPTALAATYACSGLTAYTALNKVGKLGPKDKLLIIGAGGVGISAVRMAKDVTGIASILADIDPAKRALALENGAVDAIDPAANDAGKQLKKSTGGVAAAVDFVGAEPTVRFGMSVLRKQGKLVIVGLFGGSLQVSIPVFPLQGITLQGSMVGTLFDLQRVIALAQHGLIPPIPYTTRPLSEASQALDDMKAGKLAGRVVLVP